MLNWHLPILREALKIFARSRANGTACSTEQTSHLILVLTVSLIWTGKYTISYRQFLYLYRKASGVGDF